MINISRTTLLRRSWGGACLFAIALTLALPAVAGATGTVPTLAQTTVAGNAGTLDGPAFFTLIALILAELLALFWVGAQFWTNFVLPNVNERHPDEQALNTQIEQRFERLFSVPTLVLLLLANLGVLYGQAVTADGGNWGTAFTLAQLFFQGTNGHGGTYWVMRLVVLALALLLGLILLARRERPRAVNQMLPLINLFLGAMLFVAMTLSGDATAVSQVFVPYSVVIDWLHLIAAALWIGGMLYILLVYLPALARRSTSDRARSLLLILGQYSPLAIAGIIIMAITGPLNATFHLTSIAQFFDTAYGRALLIKVVLIIALLITSASQVFWLRPRLKKEYQKYLYAGGRLEKLQASASVVADLPSAFNATDAAQDLPAAPTGTEQPTSSQLLARQVALREERVRKKTGYVTRILLWEPWLGVAIIVCVALMNVFTGSLTATGTPPASNSSNPATNKSYNSTAKTTDGHYIIVLNISPNRFGPNVFTATITSAQTGQSLASGQVTEVTVYTTMLDMDMGTDSTLLQANGKGSFSATVFLVMSGNWGLEVQFRTSDQKLHEANFKLLTPY
jgi:copper transport protein